MAKLSKEDKARLDGMAFALRVAKEKGIDGLEEEIKFRGATNAPLTISREKYGEFADNVRLATLDSVMCLSCVTLRDEFGFGKKRLQDYIDRFKLKTSCLVGDYTTWEEQQEILREEVGIDVKIRWNDKEVIL